jgi:hypothetical protein
MPETSTDPSEAQLLRDLRSSEFWVGVDMKQWRIAAYDWPHLVLGLTAGDGNELAMRLNCQDYPRLAPAGRPWDIATCAPLAHDRWPIGGHAPQIFRHDWSHDNNDAPYMACDRTGLATHPDWATVHPQRAWNPTRTIAFYAAEISLELRGAELPQPEKAA